MKLNKIILQLTPDNYSNFSTQLKENRADKFLILLNHFRDDSKISESELLAKLDVKQAAFYTLKSRLLDKIQEFLYKNTADTRVELLQNVANIEHLVYQTQPETAISILKKLEKELIDHDMPSELIIVYKALKKLHIHSEKYYEYLQLYNKHVAYNLAHDKAEEILSIFCKTLGEYSLSKNNDTLDLLVLYKKELSNVCRLYQSHHLTIYKNILFTHFALFCPVEKEMKDDSTIEEMLKESLAIIETHPEDRAYKHLLNVINFLYFEYYNQLKLYKNATKYYDAISGNMESFLFLNHSCFVYQFLISKIKWFLLEKKEAELINEEEVHSFEPDVNNVNGFVYFQFYKASAEFYSKNYTASLQTLNKLINEVSFKNISFSEMEAKSFLALVNTICDRHDQAEVNIRSVSRKITDENDDEKYGAASLFIKIIKTSASPKKNDKLEKMIEINHSLDVSNTGKYHFLPYIKLNEEILKSLAK